MNALIVFQFGSLFSLGHPDFDGGAGLSSQPAVGIFVSCFLARVGQTDAGHA